jgi:hypothetical protein
MERRNTAQRAREEAERARIAAAAAARAQQVQVSPDYGAIVGAALGAAGAEERLRVAQDRRVERREEEMEAAEQAARERAAAEGERLRAIAEGRDEPVVLTSPGSQDTTSMVGQAMPGVVGWARRTLGLGRLVRAAPQVSIQAVEGTLRIYGPRAARRSLGFREMVNWLRPENVDRLPVSAAARALDDLVSGGTVIGIGTNLVADSLPTSLETSIGSNMQLR